jgi:hypothetical protein
MVADVGAGVATVTVASALEEEDDEAIPTHTIDTYPRDAEGDSEVSGIRKHATENAADWLAAEPKQAPIIFYVGWCTPH